MVGDPPGQCPVCHRAQVPKELYFVSRSFDNGTAIDGFYQCTFQPCGAGFLVTYDHRYNSATSRFVYVVSRLAPETPRPQNVPKGVADRSPSFVEILNQAEAASAAGLHQIHGIGLRKALEFLIKDFAKLEHPGKESEIEATPLATCIDRFVNDANVKLVSKRAAWLGNDETHYVRRWEKHDVESLRTLISLTANWIENVLLTRHFVDEMPDSKKAGPAAPPA